MADDHRPSIWSPRKTGMEVIYILAGIGVAGLSVAAHSVIGWELAGAIIMGGFAVDILFFRKGAIGMKVAMVGALIGAGLWAYKNPAGATHIIQQLANTANSLVGKAFGK